MTATALDPSPGLRRIAELAQPVDVPAQRANRDAEPAGQLVAGPVPARLEQGEQAQGAGAGRCHGAKSRAIEDRNWHLWSLAWVRPLRRRRSP